MAVSWTSEGSQVRSCSPQRRKNIYSYSNSHWRFLSIFPGIVLAESHLSVVLGNFHLSNDVNIAQNDPMSRINLRTSPWRFSEKNPRLRNVQTSLRTVPVVCTTPSLNISTLWCSDIKGSMNWGCNPSLFHNGKSDKSLKRDQSFIVDFHRSYWQDSSAYLRNFSVFVSLRRSDDTLEANTLHRSITHSWCIFINQHNRWKAKHFWARNFFGGKY